uniref:Uncharacterized protein n=1 Tax=Candidatus Kentrum sp. FW TaxID=2126338 RepID=A0A450TV76_9GAMM|nr:MAG: hypothetical protein BECKFW1821C_GA0114237_103923 [Candidatus Kentron sp. FW]
MENTKPRHTALQCLSLVARHHGIQAGVEKLIHEYSLEAIAIFDPLANRQQGLSDFLFPPGPAAASQTRVLGRR